MLEAIVTIVFIIGLLNFAQEAPDLIKNLFKGSMFDGINLNPKGQLKSNLATARKTLGHVGHVLSTPFRAVDAAEKAVRNGVKALRKGYDATVGGGIKRNIMGRIGSVVGRAEGRAQGWKAGRGHGLGGIISGMEGWFAGGDAGRQAGRNYGSLGRLEGIEDFIQPAAQQAARVTAENRKDFNKSKGDYGTMMDEFNNVKKTEIEKIKEQKTECTRKYNENVQRQVYDIMNDPTKLDKGQAQTTLKNQLVAEKAKELGISEDAVRGDIDMIRDINNSVLSTDLETLARIQAENMYKATYDKDIADYDVQIATKQAEGMKDHTSEVLMAMSHLELDAGNWGTQLNNDFAEQLKSGLKDMKNSTLIQEVNDALNAALGTTGKNYAGKDQSADANIDISQLSKIADSLTKSGKFTALSQIMNKINDAAGKINTSQSITEKSNEIYNPQPKNEENKTGDNK